MGSQYNSATFPASNEAILKAKFIEYQEQLRFEYGNDPYSGHLGKNSFEIYSKVFKNVDDAEQWVQENTNKWGPAIAVKVGDFSLMFPATSADKKIFDSFNELKKTIDSWDSDILKRVKSAKSQQRACSKCSSKISVSFLKTVDCPVCNNHLFLKTETDQQKFKALQVKYFETENKLNEAKKKHNLKGTNAVWYVGGWSPS